MITRFFFNVSYVLAGNAIGSSDESRGKNRSIKNTITPKYICRVIVQYNNINLLYYNPHKTSYLSFKFIRTKKPQSLLLKMY